MEQREEKLEKCGKKIVEEVKSKCKVRGSVEVRGPGYYVARSACLPT